MKRLKKILTILEGIYNYNLSRHFRSLKPTELQINVTYLCNSRCQMCQIWKLKPKCELTAGEWQRIMEDPIFLGIRRLSICGGEPTLHPNLITLVKLFLKSMPNLESLSLVTNGLLSSQIVSTVKSMATLLKKRKIDFSVSVSLDGIGNIHNLIRGVPDAFEKTSKTIKTLKGLQSKYDFSLGAAGVILRENLQLIRDVENWCSKLEIPFNYQIVGFHETYVQNIERKKELDFGDKNKEDLYSLLKELSLRCSLRNPRAVLRSYYWNDMLHLYKGGLRTTPCPFVLDAFVLDSLGDVYYCLSEKKIGNCREGKSIGEIYYNPRNLALRRQRAKTICLKCNSACFISSAIVKDFKKFFWFYLTGKRGTVGVY